MSIQAIAAVLLLGMGGVANAADTSAPSIPGGFRATRASATQINLLWYSSSDNVGIREYRVERCQGNGCTAYTQIASTVGRTLANVDAGLVPTASFSFRVRAVDTSGNLSGYSATSTVAASAGGDTQPPAIPTGLRATRTSATQINLLWYSSSDNVGIREYRVERCQGNGCTAYTQIASTVGRALANADPALVPSASFSFRVRAVDTSGNLSGYSATSTVAASAGGDTQAPAIPTGLRATRASGTEIDLSWTAASDNVGIREYRVERCQGVGCTAFSQIGSAVGPYLANWDPVLVPTASFSFRVRAVDTSGNLSGYSTTSTVAPSGGGTSGVATVSWQPPLQRTDGSVLTNLAGYEIRYGTNAAALDRTVRLNGQGLTRYVIDGLPAGTWHFGVVAFDSANLNSAMSAVRTKTVP